MKPEPLSVREKIGYGLGDTASNIVFQVVVNFMLIFYTDVFGISAAAAGVLMLVVRIFDAVTDPIMGGIADRTHTRWGRYRPYLVYTSIPYAVLAVVAFTTPDLSENGKLVYAYITYALLMTAYTAVNIPYSALGGVITANPKERASVQSFRFALAMVGGVIITALLPVLVERLGAGDAARGYQLAMGVFATLALGCFLVCFWTTRERVTPKATEHRTNLLQDVVLLLKNDQWLVIAGVAFVMLVLVATRGAVAPFYVRYYLWTDGMDLAWLAGCVEWLRAPWCWLSAGCRTPIEMTAAFLMSVYISSGMLGALLGAVFTNYASRYINKVALFKGAAVAVCVFHCALFVLNRELVFLSFLFFILANFAQMILVPLMFSMVADSADYGELKTGTNILGMACSGHLLAIKLGLAVGGLLTGWMLGHFGYQPNQAQTEMALTGILLIFALLPAGCGLVLFGLMFLYRLSDRTLEGIHAHLNRRGAGGEDNVVVDGWPNTNERCSNQPDITRI